MPITFEQNLGTNSVKTSGTSLAVNFTGATKPAVGDLVVMVGARNEEDPNTNSVSDGQANTYTVSVHAHGRGVLVFAWCLLSVAWPSGTNTFTWTMGTVVAKAMVLQHFKGVAAHVGTTDSFGNTSADRSITVDNLALGIAQSEAVASSFTADTDTLNGSWSSLYSIGTTGNPGHTNQSAGTQYKVVTATGTQSFKIHSSTEGAHAIAEFSPSGGEPPPPFQFRPPRFPAAIIAR